MASKQRSVAAAVAECARMEIRVLLEEMIKQGTRFEQTAPLTRTNSNFVNGIAAFPGLVTRS